MSMHQTRRDDRNDDEPFDPPEWPNSEWTPKQQENYERHMRAEYEALETDVARYWYRRVWRPKMRNDGAKKRDHVKLGTPEDYVEEHVSDTFDPWGNFTGVMMRRISSYSVDKSELEDAISEIVRVKLERLAENDPQRARELLANTERVASLYGV